jgi:hypothetical protein
VLACSLTLLDAFKSNLKHAEWGINSSLANLEWVASRLRRSTRSCKKVLLHRIAKVLIGDGRDARAMDNRSFAISIAVGLRLGAESWFLFPFGLASVEGSVLLFCIIFLVLLILSLWCYQNSTNWYTSKLI